MENIKEWRARNGRERSLYGKIFQFTNGARRHLPNKYFIREYHVKISIFLSQFWMLFALFRSSLVTGFALFECCTPCLSVVLLVCVLYSLFECCIPCLNVEAAVWFATGFGGWLAARWLAEWHIESSGWRFHCRWLSQTRAGFSRGANCHKGDHGLS